MVLAVLPFGNQARFVAVNGTTLKLMLEYGVSDLNPNGRFPAVHGMEFEYDPARPAGSRVTTVTVRRRAFSKKQRTLNG
jgi:5'-nucleotidase/UDP-sugar diphosphatase